MSILVSLSIFPLDKGESVSTYVARILETIDKSGIPYKLTPMDTVIEVDDEELDKILSLIKESIRVLEKDCNRIIVNIKMDYRKGRKGGLTQKQKSVEEKVGRSLDKA
ncbi:MTH1187 family thiamine-binding protein [Thermodesulfobacterium hydrogeniphilum]|uniref:MTH1187 family thiamine-binding protein n=1 Tax=Thermodesulfobacterium hydrogeniphilum TaxID=161156 RepID=UPI000571ECA3|nr:MTH1187 family thiamine-binding protein [Thermodesulfobacterium hydrogeniphilum]